MASKSKTGQTKDHIVYTAQQQIPGLLIFIDFKTTFDSLE